ncbi:helix-turn-helix domain-containing protein [Streptomyces sp. BH055]|uniref:helix-turn-helix domain-containing protein n=1 Tax=unclassified Streptomyces TaxID=2593676 RepID=UPI003BB5E602
MTETRPDPTGIPEGEHMTPAAFRVAREFLALPPEWLAENLAVSIQTIRHWEQGTRPIPETVRRQLEDLQRLTGEFIDKAVEQLIDVPEPGIVTFRTDAEYHAGHPESAYPASWHRAVCARIAREVPGIAIAYADAVQSEDVKVEAE